MATKNATLNPASMPFFPGSTMRGPDEDGVGLTYNQPFRRGTLSDLDRASISSSLSISPSDYRSMKSSPSPPQDDGLPRQTFGTDLSRGSPTFRSFEAGKQYQVVESRLARENSMFGALESLAEAEDNLHTPGLDAVKPPGQSSYFSFMQQQGRERVPAAVTPPVNMSRTGPQNQSGAYVSSSPGSSHGSGATSDVQQIEAQLKTSPFIYDLVERLSRCEITNREIQRELADVHRKVNLLLERSIGGNPQPEFQDPFAPRTNGPSMMANGPRPSLANIAPNQVAPSDDISTISQRLNTLTSSVGQLLAIQTQQIQSTSAVGNHTGIGPHHQGDMGPPPMMQNSGILGHGLPNRPDMRRDSRAPNPPMRTWSAGALELQHRPSEPNIASMARQDSMVPRDKRRSVSALMRRDSSGVNGLLDTNGDRDGPVVSKWEQLQLSPELLRSLTKFGVGPPNKIQQRALPFLLRGADIIAQAPPTQERIAAYVIPAIQIALTHMSSTRTPNRGPVVIMISTTVDQATQAQRMIRDLGGPIGVRSALGVGATSASNDLSQELRLLQQNNPHIICGTPQKLHALFTSPGGLIGSEVRFLVLDEVDQLIARNLHDFVYTIVKLLPVPRNRPSASGSSSSNLATGANTPNSVQSPTPADPPVNSGFGSGRRFSMVSPKPDSSTSPPPTSGPERQTALFSNTVPQDVLNLATTIQLREPVRVLVRRDGNVTQSEAPQGARGLRQFYLYLAFTAGGRLEPSPATPAGGLGIIGSGRGASSAETVQAREWKLDALADLLDDVETVQAVVHVGGMTALDSVVYKLASRGIEAIPLHGDMGAPNKLSALNKYRNTSSMAMRSNQTKVLVVYDVQVKDISQVPLIINYDLPKAVEEYAHRVSPAIAPNNYSRAGVIVNFVTATGGDVEMLRSIECFYKIKCPEVPMSLRDIV